MSFCLVYSNSFSTHIIGGELTYRCISGENYEITLSVYTECGSTAILEQFYPIKYYAEELGISPDSPESLIVNKISTREVQLLCNSAVTDCNGGALRGVELVTYRGTVNLSGYAKTTDWRFFWKRSARSEQINTLVVPEGEDFFVEASLNNLNAPCNSSPTFQNSALATACIGQEYVFNNAASDRNNDELRYSLATPKSDYDTDVVFETGYDSAHFITPNEAAVIDPSSGDLMITPDLLSIGITDIIVEEYRSGTLVGWVRRAIQFTIIDCSNTQPELSSFKESSTDSVSVCARDAIALTIEATDVDGDNLTMTLLSGNSGVFNITGNNTTNPKGVIYFNTDNQDVGIHQFVVKVSDNVCPQPGVETKTYTINVLETPNFDLGSSQDIGCTETINLAPTVTGGDGSYSYAWSDGSSGTSLDVGIGYHSLTVTDGNGCSFTDFILISSDLQPNFSVDSLCIGQTTLFTDLSVNNSDSKNIASWEWSFGDGTTSTEQNPAHTYSTAGDYEVTLTITDDGSPVCTYDVTKTITICNPPDFDFSTSGYCNYDQIQVAINPVPGTCDTLDEVTFDFGDGTTLSCTSCLDTTHVYQDPG
ncbi:PKD domain-containing protein, partial [Fulvivirga aurantia]|uniref:PKD domain-containing protein n=1 Tax=Fulvivirga aurantia TaxID=2529383 RepID=UPI0012BB4EC2